MGQRGLRSRQKPGSGFSEGKSHKVSLHCAADSDVQDMTKDQCSVRKGDLQRAWQEHHTNDMEELRRE